MDFSFDDHQDELAGLAEQIIGDASEPGALRTLERSGEPRLDRTLWRALGDAGVIGIAIPERSGGAGLSLVEIGRVLEVAGRHAAAVPLWETMALGAYPLGLSDAEPAAEWLRRAATGDAILTAAWTDDAGDDPLAPATTATGSELGATVAVSGTKVCVPAGTIADAVVVIATANSTVAAVLVDTTAAGVTVEPLTTTTGGPDAAIVFDGAEGVVVASGNDAIEHLYDVAVATQCAFALGTSQAALALTADYTKERKQFDVAIATFQAVGHRVADAYVDTEAIRLTTWQALWRLAEGLDASEQVAIAKFWVAWGGQRVVHAAAHLHGGVGVDRDYPLHRHFLAAKNTELQLGGTTQSLRRLGRKIAASAGGAQVGAE